MVTQALLKQLPNVKVVSTVSQQEDEEAWKVVRNSGIGGSDVGAICGVSPFSSARKIYFDKTGQFAEGFGVSEASKERMHFGHLLEPIVANEYVRQTGHKVVELGATVCHKDYPWMRANVDRLILDENDKIIGILECKTTSEYNNDAWESGDILMSYMYQLQWYMYILNIKYGAFAVLVGGNKFYHYEVFRNDALLEETILPAVKDFWYGNVLALKEPELQYVDTEYVNGTYNEVEKDSEVVLDDDDSDALANVVFECKTKIKELERTMEEAQNRLKDKLKDKEIGYCRNYTIKWSPRSTKRVDTNMLKANFPEVYEQCVRTSNYRVFTVKGVQ